MKRSWMPDPGWTGDWRLPDLLRRPISDTDRARLVSLSVVGFGPKRLVEALSGAADISVLDAPRRNPGALEELVRIGARAVVPSDDEYPEELAAIAAPPPLLYVRGERLDELRPVVAVVGARACTHGAARFAERLGEALAGAGFSVASGLARGVDAAAHRGALRAGKTLAVFGTGIDVCYPKEHEPLVEHIVSRGAVVSEFPPSVGPRRWHFPSRNRIIAGLSCAVVVVEAGLASGALITAGFALDQGRHVMACITGPENPAGAGVRAMLLDGAQMIVDPEQAVETLADLVADQGFAFGRPVPRPMPVIDLTGELRRIYDAVTEDCSVDDVAANAGLAPARAASGLAELELEGHVTRSDGRWRRS